FTQVFDSYAQFEESMIAAKMETASELGREEEDDVDLELRLARFEQLISRKLERARDLFEQALDGCPPKYAKTLYLCWNREQNSWQLRRSGTSPPGPRARSSL
ncbi:XPA binding protein 2, isoform CRA_b, partial [Mus musculus]